MDVATSSNLVFFCFIGHLTNSSGGEVVRSEAKVVKVDGGILRRQDVIDVWGCLNEDMQIGEARF